MVKHYIEEFEQMGRALMSAEHFLPVTDVRLDMDKFGEFLRGEMKFRRNFADR